MEETFNMDVLQEKNTKTNIRKLLILYTGGTFGMIIGKDGKMSLKDSNSLNKILRQLPEFFDKKEYALSDKKYMISDIILNTRIYYNILQFENLIDSSDSTPEFIINIVSKIEENYQQYDSFLIIHGTDSMEYTGSALSFLIRNTIKTIIITGSQIPLSIIRNDAYTNLQGCFRIAAQFNIPEVCLYFKNRLLRANCTLKFDVEKFGAFDSTIPPLVEDDMNFKVNTKLIRKAQNKYVKFYKKLSKAFVAVKMNSNYSNEFWTLLFNNNKIEAILMYLEEGFQEFFFNDISFIETIKKYASFKIFYLILPSQFAKSQPQIIEQLKQSKVIINSYITYSAAICKLSFLLGNYDKNRQKLRKNLALNLRGEINIPLEYRVVENKDKNPIFKMFDKASANIDKDHKDNKSTILAQITEYIFSNQLYGFSENLYKNDRNMIYVDIDGNNPLTNNIPNMSIKFAKKLHDLGVKFDKKDTEGRNCCYLALLYENYQIADFLFDKQYRPIAPCIVVFQDMCQMIKNDQLQKFKMFIKFGFNDCNNYLDYDNTNLGMIALKLNKNVYYEYLIDFACLNIQQKNIAGESCYSISKLKKFNQFFMLISVFLCKSEIKIFNSLYCMYQNQNKFKEQTKLFQLNKAPNLNIMLQNFSRQLELALLESNYHVKTQSILSVFEKISHLLHEDNRSQRIQQDSQIMFLVPLTCPYTWESTDQLMNLLLYKFQNNLQFLSNACNNIKKILQYNEYKQSKTKKMPRLFTQKSLFNMSLEDFNQSEIINNIVLLKQVSLEYLNKILVIIQFKNDQLKKDQRVFVDLQDIFETIIENTQNFKIFKRMQKMNQEIGYSPNFYKSQTKFQELEDQIIQMVQDTADSQNSSFSKESQVLSDLIDFSDTEEQKNDFDKSNTYEDDKELLEYILLNEELQIQKNEKLTRLFLKNQDNLNYIQAFLTQAFQYPLSKKFAEQCIQSDILRTINQWKSLSKPKNAEDISEEKLALFNFRAFLVFILLDAEGNNEFLLNLNNNYTESLFESIYEGSKKENMNLVLVVYLIESFLRNSYLKTVSLLFKYNFLFLFLKKIQNSKCYDFLLTFITPNTRVYNFEQKLYNQIWTYLFWSGFFKDIKEAIIDPNNTNQHMKFDKFFTNAEIQQIIESLQYNELNKITNHDKYKKIIESFYKPKSQFDPFLANRIFNINEKIDIIQEATIKPNSNKIKNKKNSLIIEQQRDLDEKSYLMMPKISYYINLMTNYSYSAQDEKLKTLHSISKLSVNSKKKQSVNSMNLSQSILINQKFNKILKNNLKDSKKVSRNSTAVTVQQADQNVFYLLKFNKNYLDGYLGTFDQITLYPSFGHGIKENFLLNKSQSESILKKWTKKKFNRFDSISFLNAKFLLHLFQDIKLTLQRQQNWQILCTSQIDPSLLIEYIMDKKNQNIVQDIYLNFIYKINFVLDLEDPSMTSPFICGQILLTILDILKFEKYNNKYQLEIKRILREYFIIFQEKFLDCFQFYNQKKLEQKNCFEIQNRTIRDSFGQIRLIFIQIFFTISELNPTQEDLFELIDIKIIQIIFLWIVERKHNSLISNLFLKFMDNLYKIEADKFLTEVTLKLDFFRIIYDIIGQIYVNEILVHEEHIDDMLYFIGNFIKIYLKAITNQYKFSSLNKVISKIFSFQQIVGDLSQYFNKNNQRSRILHTCFN